jgi:hypothetical protein
MFYLPLALFLLAFILYIIAEIGAGFREIIEWKETNDSMPGKIAYSKNYSCLLGRGTQWFGEDFWNAITGAAQIGVFACILLGVISSIVVCIAAQWFFVK